MVEEPIDYLKPFFDAGFKRFFRGTLKKCRIKRNLSQWEKFTAKLGLAIDGPTNLDELKVDLFDLDAFAFDDNKSRVFRAIIQRRVSNKSKRNKKRLQNMPLGKEMIIEVDGGLDDWSIVRQKKQEQIGLFQTVFFLRVIFLNKKSFFLL